MKKRTIISQKEPVNIYMQTLILIVSLAILISFMMTTFSWFSSRDNGTDNVEMGRVAVSLVATYPDEILVPNKTYGGTAEIVNTDTFNNAPFFVRVKVSINTSFVQPNIVLNNGEDIVWIAAQSGTDVYYYYLGVLNSNESVTLINSYSTNSYNGVKVDHDGNQLENVTIDVDVEAVQDNWEACAELWQDMPEEWATAMGQLGYTA